MAEGYQWCQNKRFFSYVPQLYGICFLFTMLDIILLVVLDKFIES